MVEPSSASEGAALAPDPDFQAVVARLVGAAAESLTFAPLTGGVSSDIWRVGHGPHVFCAKRALPRLRVAARWEAPVSRNAEEVRWLRTARRFIGPEVAEVIAHDDDAGVALLAWYPPETWRNWKQLLLIGIAAAFISTALGTALGRIVTASARDPALAGAFDNSALFDALRIDPFFRHIETRFEGMTAILLVLVAFSWPGLTILVRSMVLGLASGSEVEAARALGASTGRILRYHVFPHTAPFVVTQLIFFVPAAILAEAGLSFLGLGDPSLPTWGQILEDGFRTGAVFLGYWWWVLGPGVALVITSVTFMLIAIALEPIVNPRLRRSGQ